MSTNERTAPKADVYTRVTSAIITAIETGAGTYSMPWVVRQDKGFSPISIATVKPYRGINTVVLWSQAQTKGYASALAVAYFRSWAPRGFFPIQNGGEEAVLFCYIYLWLVTAGAGKWSLDRLIETHFPSRTHTIKELIGSWEEYGHSLVRLILAFTFCLHGFRLALGLLPALAGRRIGMPAAIDLLPRFVGYWEIVGGILLLLGLLMRPTAAICRALAFAAYIYGAAPRGVWPIRNGGNEVLLYGRICIHCGSRPRRMEPGQSRRNSAYQT